MRNGFERGMLSRLPLRGTGLEPDSSVLATVEKVESEVEQHPIHGVDQRYLR